jgi:hypothetical protein
VSRANAVRRDPGSADSRCKGRSSVRRGMARVKQSSTHEPSQRYANHLDGDVSEHFTAYELVKQGWGVCFPQNSHASFDILAEKNGIVLRVQVKGTRSKDYTFRVRRYLSKVGGTHRHKNMTCSDCDVVALCYLPDSELFFVPVSHVKSSSFRITLKNRKQYYRNFKNLQPCNLSFTQ